MHDLISRQAAIEALRTESSPTASRLTESERGAYRAGMMAVFQILMQDQKNELTKAWFGMKGGSR